MVSILVAAVIAALQNGNPDERWAQCSSPVAETLAVSSSAAARALPPQRLRLLDEFLKPPDSASLARDSAESRLVLEALRGSRLTARLWRSQFVRPIDGKVTSAFGVRRSCGGGTECLHGGLDLRAIVGTPVIASNRGVVVLVHNLHYGGLTIILDHGAGILTAYSHLSRNLVAVGDTVARRQPIALSGATGRVTGPHLHWEAYCGFTTVDPLSLPGPSQLAPGISCATPTAHFARAGAGSTF